MTAPLLLLLLFLALPAGFALLSFAFAWYEAANRDPALLTDRFDPSALGLALKLVGLESAVLCLTTLLHPAGWIRPRHDTRAAGEETPVIFLHGLFQSRACWFWLRWRLGRLGRTRLYTLSLPPWKDLETLTERVALLVDRLRLEMGVEKVCLVGHSMGGLIARNFIQLRGGEKKVETCILLGTPNHGSKLAPFALSDLGLGAMPGSEFLARLAGTALPAGVRVCNIYSRHDNIILPPESARLEGAENVELGGMGHASLLFHPEVLRQIHQLLERAHP